MPETEKSNSRVSGTNVSIAGAAFVLLEMKKPLKETFGPVVTLAPKKLEVSAQMGLLSPLADRTK